MKIHSLVLASLLASNMAFADNNSVDAERVETVRQYINNLGTANNQAMHSLFNSDGVVYTDSRGKVPANNFFDSFLPTIANKHPNTSLISIYKNPILPTTFTASFRFTWQDADGTQHGGNFSDIFNFDATNAKLNEVDMFELIP